MKNIQLFAFPSGTANLHFQTPSNHCMRSQRELLQQKLWNSAPRRDRRLRQTEDVLQTRERISAEAAIKGKRWYARMLLQMQPFPTNREASWHLIETSRRLIADTRQRIRVVRNNMAFTRVPSRRIN